MSKIDMGKLSVLDDTVTQNQVSTIAECSVASNGKQVMVTGNWFAAASPDDGATWKYISPFSFFPKADNGFCCDQTLQYDNKRKLFLWILQYSETPAGNTMRLAVKKDTKLDNKDWETWDFVPTAVNTAWKKQWFDYNHAVLTDNYLYICTNVFNTPAEDFTRCVVLRISLDSLSKGNKLKMDYFESSDFSLRCVQGAKDIMYFAAHTGTETYNRLGVYSWPENSSKVNKASIDITPFSGANYKAKCPDGTNWIERADYRITGAWLSKGILGFMWTAAKRGTSRPLPYIRVARINIADMQLLDEPDIWSPEYAYGYPDACPDKNGVVGITLFLGGGNKFPAHLIGIFDEVSKSWELSTVRSGTNGPGDSKWGDYLTLRPGNAKKDEWIAVGFTLQGGKKETDTSVHTIRFKYKP